jgi:peptidyl-dipeptidase Dcp
MADNPFYEPSPLPFQAPPFDRIREQHYREAIEEGMRREREEVAAIAASSEPPTFDNTVAALEPIRNDAAPLDVTEFEN